MGVAKNKFRHLGRTQDVTTANGGTELPHRWNGSLHVLGLHTNVSTHLHERCAPAGSNVDGENNSLTTGHGFVDGLVRKFRSCAET
jgi:hypothetical protein